MSERQKQQARPEPPLEADVSLGGFDRIDMPIDWMGEDWALEMDDAALGALWRLVGASLRQSPAGSLPGARERIVLLVPAAIPDALDGALRLWPLHSDGRRYWDRLVPLIEEAWSRKRGRRTKDAERKRRERLRVQLVRAGCTVTGAANRDVQDAVLAELGDGRLTEVGVLEAALRAGVVSPVRPLGKTVTRTVRDCPQASNVTVSDSPRTVHGQFSDSSRTVAGQFGDTSRTVGEVSRGQFADSSGASSPRNSAHEKGRSRR